jgi:3-oxoacyl-[acyl-carrier protein] reductase
MACPVVLVTGAGRGIGRGIAEALSSAGWSVIVNYLSNRRAAEESVAACASLATRAGQRCVAIQADVSLEEDRARLVDEAFGITGALDALVNNAGIAPRIRADILDAGLESYREVMRTNLEGPYFLTQAVARRMLEAGETPGRKIVFITSVSAESASLSRGEYCLSKAGLAMAVKLWATRLASRGISVYEVRPGIMATDMTAGSAAKYDALIAEGLVPERRWGRPEDVGGAVRSLLEGEWAFSTGSVVHVDGGFHLPRL